MVGATPLLSAQTIQAETYHQMNDVDPTKHTPAGELTSQTVSYN